jgi:hypothetical protein
MYALTTRVYLEPITKEYIEVFQVEPKPKGKLLSILKQVAPLKLSPYKGFQSCEGCIFLVKNINPNRRCSTDFLAVDDLPLLFCFLTENGYDIDTKLTKLLVQGKSAATKRNLVCYIRRSPEKV